MPGGFQWTPEYIITHHMARMLQGNLTSRQKYHSRKKIRRAQRKLAFLNALKEKV